MENEKMVADILENNVPKIFTNKAISIATFFGGPLAAGFLISKNFKTFGKDQAALNSVFIGILFTIILLFAQLLFFQKLQDNNIYKLLQSLLPLVDAAIITLLIEKLQGKEIQQFLANNGQTASNWQAARYGFLGCMIIVIFFIIMIFIMPTEGYDKRINIDKNVFLHYNKRIDESKSQKIAEIIKQSGFLKDIENADLFFDEELMYYSLKFVIPDTSHLSDPLVITEFNKLKKYINYNLDFDKQIEILFTDIYLVTVSKLSDLPDPDHSNLQGYEPILYLQSYQVNDFHTIYYDLNMPVEDVKIVARAITRLKGYFPDHHRIGVIFLNNKNYYTIKFFVSENLWQEPATLYRLRSIVDYIKDIGIEKPINLVLIDHQTYQEIQITN